MDVDLITALLTGGGTILLALVGWGLKVGSQHVSFLRSDEARRLIYDVIKGQVRTTMPAVILGPTRPGGISKPQAKMQAIRAALAILGPLAKEFTKMSSDAQEATLNAAVHSVKKEMGVNGKVSS